MEEAIRALAFKQPIHTTTRHLCPSCSAERKNWKDRCLSLTVESNKFLYQCWHCQLAGAGSLTERRTLFVPKVVHPVPSPTEDEMEAAFRWLATRGVTRATAQAAGIVGGKHFINGENCQVVGFRYPQAPGPDATKWRSISSKAFSQTGSAQTLWQSHRIDKTRPCAFTEGEMDCLSLWQVGVQAVSVPNGAVNVPLQAERANTVPSGGTLGVDRKFAYLARAKELLEAVPKVIIAVDADNPGVFLGEELARRIGRAKCWRVLWPDGCKDANDVLVKHGQDALRECIENAEPWPVNGLYEASHFFDKAKELYDIGIPKGIGTGYRCVDELYTILPGQITVVTGSPGSGKSTFVDNILVNVARHHNHRVALCSFENPPHIQLAKLAGIFARQPFFQGTTPRMDIQKRDECMEWIREHFVFLHHSDGSLSRLDDILDLARAAVLRYGIRGLVIDPYNFIDRGDSNETDWVSDALTKLKVMAMAYDLHIWFVAHPTKMRRKEDGTFPVPTGYDIAGSAHFFNKADMGITIHRPDPTNYKTEFHCWKVRFNFSGKIGKTNLSYDPATSTYWEPVTGEDELF